MMRRRPKKADPVPKLVLEEVIGLTTRNADGLASDPSTGRCTYLAGCVVVLYDVETGARSHLMVSSRAPKPLSCVALARQGRGFVAAGESGNMPAILIWDCSTGNLLSELKGHQCGVQSIDFSSDGKSLVSLGYLNDGYISLWDWRSGRLLSKVKASTTFCPILSVSFLPEGSSFITIGRKHMKLWTIGSVKSMNTNIGKDLPSIDGKPVNLGCYKGSSFVSIASPAWTTSKSAGADQTVVPFPMYALAETGTLCVIDHGISIGKCVDLKVGKGFALSASDDLVACACGGGLVQLFQVQSFNHVGSLKYGESKGYVDLKSMSSHAQASGACPEDDDTAPDAIACQFSSAKRLAVIYADHSFYIWDIDHIHKVSKSCILVAHSACIWDVSNLPCKILHKSSSIYEANGCGKELSFATCSADGTIRLWGFLLLPCPKRKHEPAQLMVNQPNCSSVDNELVSSVQLVSCGILERDNAGKELHSQGFRSMAVSSDGRYLAAGDCRGNLHVFDLHTSEYTCIEEAHETEILSVNFSSKQAVSNGALENQQFLVTGSRDRMIHLHNVQRSFDLIESLADHSAPVTSVILACDGSKLLSCSTDRSILARDVHITDVGCRVTRKYNQHVSHGTIMAIEPIRKLLVTVGQDKKINKYNLSTGKLVGSFKEEGDCGEPIKVTIDSSGSYLACSYSNKSLRIYDFASGELVAQAMGHAEAITGSVFLSNCKHIVSVGGDSCILIWKLPALLSSKMLQKTTEHACCLPTIVATQSIASPEVTWCKEGTAQPDVDFDHVLAAAGFCMEDSGVTVDSSFREDSAFNFSISRLPKWAQTKVTSKLIPSQESVLKNSNGGSSSKCLDLEISEKSIASSLASSSSVEPGIILSGGRDIQSAGDNIKGCNWNDATEAMSPDIIAIENPSMLLAPGNAKKVPSCRVDCMLHEQEVDLDEERDNDSDDNVTTCRKMVIEKVQDKRLDAEKLHVSSNAAEIGICSNEFLCHDIDNQYYGNLSTIRKLERRSSIRKRFSTRFHIRCDCLSSCKRLFVIATENMQGVASAVPESPLDLLAKSVKEIPQPVNINQGKRDDNSLPSCPYFPQKTDIVDDIKSCLTNSSLTINGDHMPSSSNRNEIQWGTDECRAALHNLDEAAETALRLCTELRAQDICGKKKSDGLTTELFALLTVTVPSILEKVQALADLTQLEKDDSGSNYRQEALNLEPTIERSAESLSHRVLELLNKNL